MATIEKQFITLLDEHQNLIHKICRLYAYNNEEHNDLFQEICIQLWRSYPKFKGDSKFSTWAYQVGLNTAISLYRKSLKEIKTSEISFEHLHLNNQEYDSQEEEQLKSIYKAIKTLNDIEKAIVYLFLEDKNYKEISEILGITQTNARVRINRVKTKLKTLLNP